MTSAVATMSVWEEEGKLDRQQLIANDDDDASITGSFCDLIQRLDEYNEYDNVAWSVASKHTVATLTETDALQDSSDSLLYVLHGDDNSENVSQIDLNASYRLAFSLEVDDGQQATVIDQVPWLSASVIKKIRKVSNCTNSILHDLSAVSVEETQIKKTPPSKSKKNKKSSNKTEKKAKKSHKKDKTKSKKSSRRKTSTETESTIVQADGYHAVDDIRAAGSAKRPAVQTLSQVQQEEPQEKTPVDHERAESGDSDVVMCIETASLDATATMVETVSFDCQDKQLDEEGKNGQQNRIKTGDLAVSDSLSKAIHVQDDDDSCASPVFTDSDHKSIDDEDGCNHECTDPDLQSTSVPIVFRSRQIAPMFGKSLSTVTSWVPALDRNDTCPSQKCKPNNKPNDEADDDNQNSPEILQPPSPPIAFRSRPIAPMMKKGSGVRPFLPNGRGEPLSAGPQLGAWKMTADIKSKLLAHSHSCLLDDDAFPEKSGELYQLRRQAGFKDLCLMQHIQECSQVRQKLNSVGDPETLRKQKIAAYIEQFKRQKPRGKQTHGLSEVEVRTQRANLKSVQTKQKYGINLQEEHHASS